MNRKEWLKACDEGWAPRRYDNASREIQRMLKYNSNPNATTRHHLMNTPEQIEYNTNHYEMWGFNEDGTFEYGKYIIFCTEEEHHSVWHNVSGENNPMYGKHHTEETRQRLKVLNSHEASDELRKIRSENAKDEKNPMYGKHHTDESREKISNSLSGENHPMYGKHFSKDHNEAISNSLKGKKKTDEHRLRLSEAWKHRAPDSEETRMKKSIAAKGRPQSDEEKKKRSESLKKYWAEKHKDKENKLCDK